MELNMFDFIQSNESSLRLFFFLGVLFLMSGLEALFPRKKRTQRRRDRWVTNIGIVIFYTVLMRLIFPLAAIGIAVIAAEKGWGLLNVLALPVWAHFVLSVILLDFAIYWQHVASHKIPILWSLHKMHHADRDIDATTGIRFHPIEIILSMIYKMVVVLLVGPMVVAVLVFEIILNALALFNHANVRLPLSVDRAIRKIFVTPDMHRVHHSVVKHETDSNFGFNLSIWDHLFGSYTAQPAAGHDDMIIGLPQYQSDKPSSILWSLKLPFLRR
jgi:sterol desaturase/sphingolipid hydroxylase (fatty acid hydroxylase superfamily)